MPNWDRVEELRAKGLDWKAIAKDPKVGFTPPKGATNPGPAPREAYAGREEGILGRFLKSWIVLCPLAPDWSMTFSGTLGGEGRESTVVEL